MTTPPGRKTKPQRGDRRYGRSRVSNGSALLPNVDGRNVWARRCRDLIADHLSDHPDASIAERSIIRRAAVLTTELEQLEVKFALAGEAHPNELDLYQRVSNSLRRLLESVGLERRSRDVTPEGKDLLRRFNEELQRQQAATP
jgi:hypothetical protein